MPTAAKSDLPAKGDRFRCAVHWPSQFPDAEIALVGVEEPQCRIHAPDESVDPSEIENLAFAEALFLSRYGS